MDTQTADILNETTKAFYATQAHSFSSTRKSAWAGWKRVVSHTKWNACPEGFACAVLDVACGNVRFKHFLQREFPQVRLNYRAIDNCEVLVGRHRDVEFVSCDLVHAAIHNEAFPFSDAAIHNALRESPSTQPSSVCPQLSVCFGFFHHVPGNTARTRLLRALSEQTAGGGVVAISLWRFMDSEALATKARISHAEALDYFRAHNVELNLDENDYLLGWQHAHETFRYAHHFTQHDVDELVQSVGDIAQLIDSFSADGRTNNLNEYLVFRVLE